MYRIANVLITAVLTVNAAAAVLPAGFNQSTITTSLSAATAMALAADGRIFVAQQNGALRIISDGALLAQPFVSLNVSSVGERGLLGVTLDPNFESNGFVYVYYTTAGAPIHNRVSRFTASGNVAAAGSEVVLLELDNLSGATNHNGGALHFGPDGKLYIATGENANGPNSQSLANMLGKILRINSNGTIPADNPFYSQSSGNNRAIWALGLRNPYRFTFQNGTGRMFINDVGQNSWEEINAGSRGANYGWPSTEGPTTDSRYTSPVLAYGHGTGPTVGCSITGGAFYNPAVARFPANYVGKYFFGDFCSGWIRVLDPATRTASGFATGAGYVVDLAVSSTGKLLILNRSSLVEVDWPSGGDGSSIWTAPTINEPWRLDSPVTLGVKFRSDVGGYVNGIRFWKSSASDNGLHVGLLYSRTGAVLAQATFSSESTSGWQQVKFDSPVAISPGVTYIAAYFTRSGWSADGRYFADKGADTPPLHALRSGVDGGNGVYTYGSAPAFPVTSRGANYWVDVSFTPASLWGTPSLNEPWRLDNPVTLGVKFRSDVAGYVRGIRFWKASASDNGPHVGLLYSSTGTLLAQATFTAETGSGWQQVNFSSPVAISPDTTYVAAYFTRSGWAATAGFFVNRGGDTPPLHALRSGLDGGNAVYTYASGPAFPVTSRGANYWVDLVFAPR